MSTRTRSPNCRADALPISHEVDVPSGPRLSSFYRRLVKIPGSGHPGSFRSVPARADVCPVPGCSLEMEPRTWDDGTRYRECPNPEHPDTLSAAWGEREARLETDPPPPSYDVQGRL